MIFICRIQKMKRGVSGYHEVVVFFIRVYIQLLYVFTCSLVSCKTLWGLSDGATLLF